MPASPLFFTVTCSPWFITALVQVLPRAVNSLWELSLWKALMVNRFRCSPLGSLYFASKTLPNLGNKSNYLPLIWRQLLFSLGLSLVTWGREEQA